MKKIIFLSFGVLLLTAFVTQVAYAGSPIIRSGETVSIESNQVLEGDFYGMGETMTISGLAERDVYALGGTITLNAPVREDFTVLGGTIQVHGAVGDDIRVVGGDVVIAEPVTDDLVIIAGKATILSTATVGGDIIFYGGELSVDGRVEGTIYGGADTVRIDSYVGGDITLKARSSLTLGNRTEVAGNISYESPQDLVRSQDAIIMGTVTRSDMAPESKAPRYQLLLIDLLIIAFSGLTVFFLLKNRTERLLGALFTGYGRFGLIGLGMLFALPLVSLIFLVSGIGAIVGLTILFSYLSLLFLSFMLLPVVFGALTQKIARLGNTITVFTVLIGTFVLLGILFIPVLGFLVVLVAFLICLGLLCNETYHFLRKN